MFEITRLLFAAGVLAMVGAPLAVRADSTQAQPEGKLVYNFSYSAKQDVTARDSANGAQGIGAPNGAGTDAIQSNGISHYGGNLTDKGTMTVEVVRTQPDGALVVSISEAGENIRRAPPATCVVYGNTNVICDPNKTVYTEEFTLLRFLAANFVNPDALDAKRHWQIVQDSGEHNIKADYTIGSNNNGMLQINEVRSVRERSGGTLTTDIQSKIGYDSKRAIPMAVDEYVTQRHDDGVQGTTTTIYQTTLSLVSDTMAKQ